MTLEFIGTTTVRVRSTLLQSYIDDLSLIDTFTATLEENCCDELTEYTVGLSGEDLVIAADGDGNYIDIVLADLADGVYQIELSLLYLSGSNSIDTGCRANIDPCAIHDALVNDPDNFTIIALYEAIQIGANCDTCFCENICTLYTQLVDQLANNDTTCSSCQ